MSIKRVIISLLILVVCFSIGVLVFFNNEQGVSDQVKLNILEKTWAQLSISEQNEVANGISDGSVEVYLVTNDTDLKFPQMNLQEKCYGQEVYIVTFISIKRDFLGDIIKVVDKNGVIIGYNLRA